MPLAADPLVPTGATGARLGGPQAVPDAVLACLVEDGVRQLTVGSVAERAGVSRASLYRWYPGGRADLLVAAAEHAVDDHLRAVHAALTDCETVEDLLTAVVAGSVRRLRDDELLHDLLDREPEIVLPLLAFDRMTVAFDVGEMVLGPHLRRVAPDLERRLVTEWVTRLVLSHVVHPSPVLDLADPAAARRVVTTHVLPGLFDLTTKTP